jgi:2,4-dienoyl-CoA reductase (NADPH2)
MPVKASREIYLLQRKTTKVGAGLGKTTGWAHRTGLLKKGVKMFSGVSYQKIDHQGLHIEIDGQQNILDVDNIIICTGQEPNRRQSIKGHVWRLSYNYPRLQFVCNLMS